MYKETENKANIDKLQKRKGKIEGMDKKEDESNKAFIKWYIDRDIHRDRDRTIIKEKYTDITVMVLNYSGHFPEKV